MKNLLLAFLLVSATLFAQQNEKKWDKIIANENEGKIKSANEIVSSIYKKAIKEKDEIQIIKCFFYQAKYLQILEENAQVKILSNLKDDIDRVSTPSKAILNLVYAKCLTEYYNQNKYKITKRTNTDETNDNFLTWTVKELTSQIDLILQKSQENEALLKTTPLTKYEAIFDYSEADKFKKMNLLSYVISENIALQSQRINSWEIQKSNFLDIKKELLANSDRFVKLDMDSVSNENLKLTLKLYQKQEINNSTPENIWERIQFCKKYIIDTNEDYIQAITLLQKTTNNKFLIQNIQLEKANYLSQNASKQTHPDYNIKALATLDSILQVNNRSNAHKLAIEKKDNIQYKTLNVQLQKYIYNNENTRAYIQYKNVENLKISFFKIDQVRLIELSKSYMTRERIRDSIVKNIKPTISKPYTLSNKGGYFEYTTEVLLPQLQTGSYLVYFESDSDSKDKKATAFETITVSNFIVMASQDFNSENYQVLDRKTGKPLENVTIKSPSFTITTDKKGLAFFKKENNLYNNNESIKLYTVNDTLSIQKNYISYNSQYDQTKKDDFKGKVEFYLDRAIYRPGQPVYYKAIAFQKKNEKKSVVPYTTFSIIIEDANSNEFKKFNVTTNEFGSFSGDFILPKSGATGEFSIEAEEPIDYEEDKIYDKENDEHPFWDSVDFEDSKLYFNVEEYKRPKFEVTFEPKKESFQLNQSVKVNGTAKAFAGSSISDAPVTYTVIRSINYYRNYYAQEQNEVVETGKIKTDASGKFAINFTAIPAKNSVKEQLPIFSYLVKVSVTDINGETHDAETTIKVGYHDLQLDAIVPNQIFTNRKNAIKLTSTNLNEEFKETTGEVKIYFVNPLSTKFKTRIFPQPDIETIPLSEFEKLFPYENQSKIEIAKTERLVYSKNVNTKKDKELALDFISNYKSGYYKIVFSAKDSFGNLIEKTSDFTIKQSKDKFDTSALYSVKQVNLDAAKDGFALIKLTSVIPDLYVSATANYGDKTFLEDTYHIQNHESIIKIPVKKEFKNGLTVNFTSVFENEKFNSNTYIILRTPQPQLKLDVETFRNKIQPGSSESWSFKLSAETSRTEAEVLASMYDSSLDQFTTKDWETLSLNDGTIIGNNYKSLLGSEKTYSIIQNLNAPLLRINLKNENTTLMWFGFDFNNTNSNLFYLRREYQRQLTQKAKKPLNVKMISGIVKDGNMMPLPGVSITVKGTQRTIITDFDGYYEIEAGENEELVFAYIGYTSKSATVAKNKVIDIILDPEESSLNEVVVVGYGTQKKKSVTGSMTQIIRSEVVEEDNEVYNTASALSGMVSGVQISNVASSPEYYFN
ncbi:MG2 domain-containing protein [Flavobacterium sp. H4147]|uniref:MG2 domain-containing protein n=1 Tax=Flavobacterium sp. H4147 TaxID=3034149 RepID=UPI0023EC5417|nr:MG2 domain-containing protein [Flavobacterium sp. H4147]